MRRLVLVRHGQSIWNAETRIQGQQCAGLSPAGHAQAEQVGRALASLYPQATLVTSDLQRTVETAAPLAAALGREPRREPRLRERSFGTWEGRLRHQVIDEQADRWRRWLTGEDVVPEVDGESNEQLAARVVSVLQELIASTAAGGTTVAVTHGGPIWHGTHALLDLRPGTLAGVANASVTELIAADVHEPGAVALDRWNELAHLPVGLRTEPVVRAATHAPPVGR